jgi:hypothetical protein
MRVYSSGTKNKTTLKERSKEQCTKTSTETGLRLKTVQFDLC